MEEDRKRNDPMDIERPGSSSPPSTTYGSPSFSPPELEVCTGEKGDLKNDYDRAEDENNGERRETRRKAKRKTRASSPEEDDDDDDDDDVDDDDEEKRAARRKFKGKARAYSPREEKNDDKGDEHRSNESARTTRPNPPTSHPTAVEDSSMDMDDYWAGYENRFGDTDAAINETLSSPSSPSSSDNYEADNENDPLTTLAAGKPSSERRDLAKHDKSELADKLAALQQQQASGAWGRGRGRGRGNGWGLEWQETKTQEKVKQEGWGIYEDPYPSPVDEVMDWEVYDASAWERATERAKLQEARKVTLKMPPVTRGEGSRKVALASSNVTIEDLMRQGGEYVRAVTDYKAILRYNYLTYEKGDVMEVVYRDSDGKLFTLLPLKDRTWSGRAHTKNFVPVGTAEEQNERGNEAGDVEAERKGG